MLISSHQTILVGIFEGFSWVRCEGKGSFINSPLLKSFVEGRIADGETCVVVDLGGCSGMDSTFMGTLAGMNRFSSLHGAVLQMANVADRNLRSLEDLGLNLLLEINPADTSWNHCQDEIREQLQTVPSSGRIEELAHAKLSLEAHKTLSALNDENESRFLEVVTTMEQEVAAKQSEADHCD